MMKACKKCLTVFIATLLVGMFTLTASAAEPRYVPCPNSGKHTMQLGTNISGGTLRGSVYEIVNGNRVTVFTNGYAYQCTKCYLVLVTQKRAAPIGKYGLDDTWTYNFNGQQSAIDLTNGMVGNITSTPDAIIGGMEFI